MTDRWLARDMPGLWSKAVTPRSADDMVRQLRSLAGCWLDWYERDPVAPLFMSATLLIEAADYIERMKGRP
jgi:hypothetical protein